MPFVWIAIGVGALLYSRYAGAPVDTTRSSGLISLYARVPYRFTVFIPRTDGSKPLDMTFNATVSESLKAIVTRGLVAAEMREEPQGMVLSFIGTPTVPSTITVGKPLFGAAILASVTRIDGKSWSSP
jgi:hypothetical protein